MSFQEVGTKHSHCWGLFRKRFTSMNHFAFNCLRLMYDYANKTLPLSFDNTWIRNSETEGYNLRNGDDFQIARFHFSSLKSHPYFNFPKQWNDLNKDFKLTMHRSVFLITLKNIYFTLLILLITLTVFVNFAATISKIWLITSTYRTMLSCSFSSFLYYFILFEC